jgi:phage terminase small subunit
MNKNKQIAAKRAAAVATDQAAKPRKLTPKMEAFCLEYIVDFNATQAAIRAGYSERSAKAIANEMMCDPMISERIQQMIAERAQRTEVTADRVLREVARIGLSDVRRLFTKTGTMKPIHELDDDTAAAVASIEVMEEFSGRGEDRVLVGHVKKIKLWDKNSAAEKLMKHLGMFEKDNAQGAEALRSVLVEFVSAGQK